MNPDSADTFPKHILFEKKVLKCAQHDTILRGNVKGSQAAKKPPNITPCTYIKVVHGNTYKTSPVASGAVNRHGVSFFDVVQSHIDIAIA